MDKQWRPSQRNGQKPFKKGGDTFRHRTGDAELVASTQAEELAEYVLRILARESETVQISRESLHPGYSKIVVTSDPAITGRLIGKGGKTISALRELVRTVARERGKRVDIEVC